MMPDVQTLYVCTGTEYSMYIYRMYIEHGTLTAYRSKCKRTSHHHGYPSIAIVINVILVPQ